MHVNAGQTKELSPSNPLFCSPPCSPAFHPADPLITLPPPTGPHPQVLYEGQEHCSRMVPQERGIVDWGGAQDAGETMLLAALRPVGDAPLELTLFGAWDAK